MNTKIKRYVNGFEFTITNDTGKNIILKKVESGDFVGLTEIAKKAATNFYHSKQLTEQNENSYITEYYIIKDKDLAAIYIFNMSNNGYICMSADYNSHPVLAYSFNNTYNPEKVIAPFQMWIDEYKHQIQQIRKNEEKISAINQTKWKTGTSFW